MWRTHTETWAGHRGARAPKNSWHFEYIFFHVYNLFFSFFFFLLPPFSCSLFFLTDPLSKTLLTCLSSGPYSSLTTCTCHCSHHHHSPPRIPNTNIIITTHNPGITTPTPLEGRVTSFSPQGTPSLQYDWLQQVEQVILPSHILQPAIMEQSELVEHILRTAEVKCWTVLLDCPVI